MLGSSPWVEYHSGMMQFYQSCSQAHLVAPEGVRRWLGWQQAGPGPAAGGTAPLERGRGQPAAAFTSQANRRAKPDQPGPSVSSRLGVCSGSRGETNSAARAARLQASRDGTGHPERTPLSPGSPRPPSLRAAAQPAPVRPAGGGCRIRFQAAGACPSALPPRRGSLGAATRGRGGRKAGPVAGPAEPLGSFIYYCSFDPKGLPGEGGRGGWRRREARGRGAEGRGDEPVAVSRHIPSADRGRRERVWGPGWAGALACGGRAVRGLGRPGGASSSRKQKPNLPCHLQGAPLPVHAFLIYLPRAFHDGRRSAYLPPLPPTLLAAAARGRRLWAAALTRSEPQPDRRPLRHWPCPRAPGGPVAAVLRDLLPCWCRRCPQVRPRQQLPGNSFGWVETEMCSWMSLGALRKGMVRFSCPPLLPAPPCVTGKSIRRKERKRKTHQTDLLNSGYSI
ncbi:uncharacterized protein LOC143692268 [Agelaius phoeniceus]|uniref:uncharacterized protein LOC143692268 n=1 Tax=Agelaius phoeniceus TaxID=39638 RepID=UPI004054F2E7